MNPPSDAGDLMPELLAVIVVVCCLPVIGKVLIIGWLMFWER